MPNNGNKSIAGNLSKSSYTASTNSLPWGPSIDCGGPECDIEDARVESYNLLPSSGYSDDTILTVNGINLKKKKEKISKSLTWLRTQSTSELTILFILG